MIQRRLDFGRDSRNRSFIEGLNRLREIPIPGLSLHETNDKGKLLLSSEAVDRGYPDSVSSQINREDAEYDEE